jgi:hypothetical protein
MILAFDFFPITDTSDDRLKQNHDAMSWFIQWENSVKSNEKIRNKEKCLISYQTHQDISVHLSNSIVALRKAPSLPRFF